MHEMLRLNSRDRVAGTTPDACRLNLTRPISGRWRLHTAVVSNTAAPVGGPGANVTPRLVVTVDGVRSVLMVENTSVAPMRRSYHSLATLITDLNTQLATLAGSISVTMDPESFMLRINKAVGPIVTFHSIFDEVGSTLSPILGVISNIVIPYQDTYFDTHRPVSLATDMLAYAFTVEESRTTVIDSDGRLANFVVPLSGNSGTTEIYRAADHGQQQALELIHPVKSLGISLTDDRGTLLSERGFGHDWMLLLEKVPC